jgi:zinc protease
MRLLKLILPCLIIVSCATTTTTKPKTTTAQAGMNVKKYVLDNGLTVLLAPNPKLPIASFYTLFDVGGRYEGKGTTGATHFLEHMMFKGAKKYGPGQFDTLIEKNGGMTNAYTTSDATVYYQNIPASFVPTMIDLEAELSFSKL